MAKQRKNLTAYCIGESVPSFFNPFCNYRQVAGWIGKTKELEVELAREKKYDHWKSKCIRHGTAGDWSKIAPEVSGEIMNWTWRMGIGEVRKILVKIRPDILKSQLERYEASLARFVRTLEASKASISVAEANYARRNWI